MSRRSVPSCAGPTVLVESLAHGGAGVARLDGQVVFVEGGLPGDRVALRNLQVKRRHARAEVGRVVEASPLRQAARCPQRPVCGGCPWHELQLGAQHQAKARMVVEALRRVGGIDVTSLLAVAATAGNGAGLASLPPIGHAGPELGFRLRARLAVVRVQGRTHAGYRQARSHHLADVEACPILHPALAATTTRALALARAQGWPTAELHVALGLDPLRCAAVLDVRDDAGGRQAEVLARALLDCGVAGAQVVTGDRVLAERGELELRGVIAPGCIGGPLSHDPRSFAQPQLEGNRLLVDAVVQAAAAVADDAVLELHAGAGNLTVPLAQRGARVRAVEVAPPALAWLARNLARVGVQDRVEIVAADVEQHALPELVGASPVDVLLLDPPRTGCARLFELVRRCRPRRVVYVSCDPVTLARDLRSLPDLGYRVQGLALLDLMPGSWHVESVLWMERAGSATTRDSAVRKPDTPAR